LVAILVEAKRGNNDRSGVDTGVDSSKPLFGVAPANLAKDVADNTRKTVDTIGALEKGGCICVVACAINKLKSNAIEAKP
jgi:hypothetical protein